MEEGAKTQEKELEKIKIKESEKDTNKQQTSAGIPKGVTKINKLYKKVDKQESLKKEAEREEKLHREYIKNKRKRKTT